MAKHKPWAMTVILLSAILGGAAAGWVVSRFMNLPQVESLEEYHPSEASHIFSDDGTLMDELFIERREVVPLDRIPLHLREAVIAVEDSRFYSHHGIDFQGIARAMASNLMAGRVVQGGSTISQQLSKVLFFSPEKSLLRKIKEAIVTLQIEKRYTKDQILGLYLNQIYLGMGCYGVAAASRRYLGKDVSDITLPEAALLAALPKSPGKYSPSSNPEEAEKRRNHVLDRMAEERFISRAEAEKSKKEPVPIRVYQPLSRNAPYFVQEVVQDLESRLGKKILYQGGLSIHTTLNLRLQTIAQESLRQGLETVIKRNRRKPHAQLQGALIAMDPANGQVKALVGGYDFVSSPFDRALHARRQPGSAFKPMIYAAALEKGYQPSDILMDTPLSFTDPRTGKTWAPQNYRHEFTGPVTLRHALENSLNIPTIRLLRNVGIQNCMDLAKRLGIEEPLTPDLSLALGTSEVTLRELTAAYAAFAAQGVYSSPMLITQVYDRNGRILENHQPEQRIAFDEDAAFQMTYLLEGVVQSGTGRIARSLNRPVAAKTGTTDDYSDAWFIGYSPELAAGVWVGYDKRTPIGPGETGSMAAGPIWVFFMQEALKNKAPSYFPVPSNIVFKKINALNGEPADSDTANVVEEAFRLKRRE
ncbi:MAG: penicillin-binding protein [Nitrospirae bacterium CG_4_9_14_3_um_filter_53_35]|nr:MAG: penicillin-binding protein [Nitrospirae bacterium CG08_land_8_20_14_0_20_52_24]PIW85550.1 MAG: penicillin-binding protein [Nitrospirae bacterium CG_4_8_14_3_um_filter_50_41]PIX86287.1 MAG: penicillin-binding protein [Nitrospirae bacterium CG_4_10_14_3_um_filter_53_41]PJA76498.1 MAG: penicillin-binding protein [Nitrospirae bacterium CG_4_9_14_3_um_filter_53_35]